MPQNKNKQEEITSSAGHVYKCEVCGKTFKAITNTHLKSHNMTTKSYRYEYPDATFGQFDRFSGWRNSSENRDNLIRMNKTVYSTPEILEKKRKAHKLVMSSEEYKLSISKIMKQVHILRPELRIRKFQPTKWMKLSNYERWTIKYGKDEADRRQVEWNSKNILPSKSRDTYPERMFAKHLDELKIEYIKQYKIISYSCDFFLPKYNLVVEIDGDHFHANPKKYDGDDVISKKHGLTASVVWSNDQKREENIKTKGYEVLRYWRQILRRQRHKTYMKI